MLRTRIITEEKCFKISSESYYCVGHGYTIDNKGKVYYDEPFINANDCKEKFDLAIQEWEAKDIYARPEKPKLEIYWKTIEEKIISPDY